ncbi:MAG: restriction endonuclease subunit S [Pseudomonas piscis]|uniref:restriction endonuclease subunit S n=1 Tax=Pseudomonas piscis TaxID=2614538 RepID=UPI003D2DDA97
MSDLNALLSLEYGEPLPAEHRTGQGFPVFGSNGEVGRHQSALIAGPGIVVGRKGSVGKVTWSDDDFWPIDTTYWVNCPPEERRWLYWVLSWLPLHQLDTSTGIPGLNRNDVYELEVYRPEAGERRQIVQILDTLDTTIRETEALIDKLKDIKQGLLYDLLTRGIDASGQLRQPQSEAPQLYKESPLGWIPREWEMVTLGECSLKIADRDHTTPTYLEEGVLMISPTNLVADEGIDFAGGKRISRAAHEVNRKKTDLAPGDVILHRIGAGLGRVRLVAAEMPEFSILHSMAQIRPNESEMTCHFMLWIMRSESTKKQMGLGTQSIGVPDLGLDKISKFLIPKPPLAEQTEIAERLKSHQRKIDASVEELEKLVKVKSGLMDDLLTGRVRVTPLQGSMQQPAAPVEA